MGYIGNYPTAGSFTGGDITDGSIETQDLKNGAVTPAKMSFATETASSLLFLDASKVIKANGILSFDGTVLSLPNSDANSLLYLNGTKGIASSTNLAFDGTDLSFPAKSANSLVYLDGNKKVSTNANIVISGNYLGVGKTDPGSEVDIKGALRLSGATSGFVGLAPAANAGNITFTLPASDGLNGQVLSTNGTGSLQWINQSAGGSSPLGSGSSTVRTAFTATEGQTSFNVNYVVGQIDVYLNGVKLVIGTDVTATTGTTIVLAVAAKAGDIVDTVVFSTQWNLNGVNLYYNLGSVGIGTDSPNALLSLGATVASRRLLVYDGGTNSTYAGFGTPDAINFDIFARSGGRVRLGEWSSGGSFTAMMSVDSNGLTNATARLLVGKDGGNYHWFKATNGAAEPNSLGYGFSFDNSNILTHEWKTSGLNRFRIGSDGKVAIATDTPSGYSLLTVNGDLSFGPLTRNQAGSYRIGLWTNNDTADDSRARITFVTTAGAASSDSFITFSTNKYGQSFGERVYIDPIGAVSVRTAPIADTTSYLQLNGDFSFLASGASTIHYNSYYNTTEPAWKVRNAGFSGAVRFVDSEGAIQFWTSPTSVAANASSTIEEQVRIDKAGRLLVNTNTYTASTNELFEVYGGMSLLDTNSDTTATLYLRNRSTTAAATIQPYLVLADNSGNRGGMGVSTSDSIVHQFGHGGITFYTGSGGYSNPRLYITSTGNINAPNQVKLGYSVAQGAPSTTDITATAHTLLGGTGGNYLAVGQYSETQAFAQWIQSAYENPTTAKYNLVLQPLGGDVIIGNSISMGGMLNAHRSVNNGPSTITDISQMSGSYALIHNQDNPGSGNKTGLFFAHAGSPGIVSGIVSTKNNGTWETNLDFYVNKFTGNPSTGIVQHAARINSNGNFGIGTVNPQYRLSLGNAIGRKLAIYDDGSLGGVASGFGTDMGGSSYELSSWSGGPGGGVGVFTWGQVNTTNGAYSEKARITNGGDLLVGTQSSGGKVTSWNPGGNAFHATINASSSGLYVSSNGQSNTMTAATFDTNYGVVGSITCGTNTAYNTTSDYRLKDNPQPLTNSGAFIDALQPKIWEWKADGSRGVGFIAHEVQAVSPGSVVGEKDAVDADGKPVMQAMEYGSAEFIANIIAELQSLRARMAQVEAKL